MRHAALDRADARPGIEPGVEPSEGWRPVRRWDRELEERKRDQKAPAAAPARRKEHVAERSGVIDITPWAQPEGQ